MFEFGIRHSGAFARDLSLSGGTLLHATSYTNSYYARHSKSDPYRVNAFDEATSLDNVVYELWRGNAQKRKAHYAFEASIELSLLGISPLSQMEFSAHWTMGCGNDAIDINGTLNPIASLGLPPTVVPEPSSMTLLGLGTLLLVFFAPIKGWTGLTSQIPAFVPTTIWENDRTYGVDLAPS